MLGLRLRLRQILPCFLAQPLVPAHNGCIRIMSFDPFTVGSALKLKSHSALLQSGAWFGKIDRCAQPELLTVCRTMYYVLLVATIM